MVYFPTGPTGDYDNDGRIDLVLVNWFKGNQSRLMHNETARRNWLNIRVRGKTINRMGIASNVVVRETTRHANMLAHLFFVASAELKYRYWTVAKPMS